MSQLVKDLAQRVAHVKAVQQVEVAGERSGARAKLRRRQICRVSDLRRSESAASRAPGCHAESRQGTRGRGAGSSRSGATKDSRVKAVSATRGGAHIRQQRGEPLGPEQFVFQTHPHQWHPAASNEYRSFRTHAGYSTTFSRSPHVRVMQVSPRT